MLCSAHGREFFHLFPELSNSGCLPGRAGGTPYGSSAPEFTALPTRSMADSARWADDARRSLLWTDDARWTALWTDDARWTALWTDGSAEVDGDD